MKLDREMRAALEADAKKLGEMTGEDHYPDYGDPPDFERFGACADCAGLGAWMYEGRRDWVECATCGGTGEARSQSETQ